MTDAARILHSLHEWNKALLNHALRDKPLKPGSTVRVLAGDYEGSVGTVLWCGREQVVVQIMGAELGFNRDELEVL